MRMLRPLLVASAAFFVTLVYLNNTSQLAPPPEQYPTLLAHRGIAQQYDQTDLSNDTCTASRILPPTQPYLENTIASMRASFDAGADVVEFDVHPTTDGKFAIFHDWTLDCRTDGHGVTRDHSLAYLKTLDVGYGYTADGGRTYPFRGKGIGFIPSLDEVIASFPGRSFLINIKSNDPLEGDLLADYLARLAPAVRQDLMVYGGDRPIAEMRRLLPDQRLMSRGSLKSCLISYIAYGWSGALPDTCRNSVVFVPINVAPWLWGWPNRFLRRMTEAGSATFVVGPYERGDYLTGIDSERQVLALPDDYSGGILTNELTMVTAALRSRQRGFH